jgi:hypothetical protein
MILLRRRWSASSSVTILSGSARTLSTAWPCIEAYSRAVSVIDLSQNSEDRPENGELADILHLCTLAAGNEEIISLMGRVHSPDIGSMFTRLAKGASSSKEGTLLDISIGCPCLMFLGYVLKDVPFFKLRLLPETVRLAKGHMGTSLEVEITSRVPVVSKIIP